MAFVSVVTQLHRTQFRSFNFLQSDVIDSVANQWCVFAAIHLDRI